MIDWKESIVDSNGNTLSDEQREPDYLPPLQLDGHCLVALGLAHSVEGSAQTSRKSSIFKITKRMNKRRGPEASRAPQRAFYYHFNDYLGTFSSITVLTNL
jgi:hypothetical protein